MAIIDGKKMAEEFLQEVKEEIFTLKRPPKLAVALVGENPASLLYVKKKEQCANALGVDFLLAPLSESIDEDILFKLIQEWNRDRSIDAILVQTPLPPRMSLNRILKAVDLQKDVDGLHPMNLGHLLVGEPCLVPCTPLGVFEMLKKKGISLQGKEVVIAGRSQLVGKPLALLLGQKHPYADATVTVIHSATKDMARICRRADVLIAAMGSPHCIRASMVKRGAVVIDVGINRTHSQTKTALVGDVAFEEVAPHCKWITPVPGGVGPMTIAMLFRNVVQCFRYSHGVE